MALKFCYIFSLERVGSDLLLYGHKLLTPDHDVPEVPTHYSGLRVYPPGLQVVQVWDTIISIGEFLI